MSLLPLSSCNRAVYAYCICLPFQSELPHLVNRQLLMESIAFTQHSELLNLYEKSKSCCCEPQMSCRFSRGKTNGLIFHLWPFHKQLHPTDAIYMLIQRGHFALWVQFVQFEGGCQQCQCQCQLTAAGIFHITQKQFYAHKRRVVLCPPSTLRISYHLPDVILDEVMKSQKWRHVTKC